MKRGLIVASALIASAWTAVEPAPSAAPPGKAQELLKLADKYEQSAKEARKRQEELLRTGVAPKGATPPGR